MVTLNEIALFIAGGFAWDAVVHLMMAAQKVEMKFIGIRFTQNLNKILVFTNSIIAILLLWYALA